MIRPLVIKSVDSCNTISVFVSLLAYYILPHYKTNLQRIDEFHDVFKIVHVNRLVRTRATLKHSATTDMSKLTEKLPSTKQMSKK